MSFERRVQLLCLQTKKSVLYMEQNINSDVRFYQDKNLSLRHTEVSCTVYLFTLSYSPN